MHHYYTMVSFFLKKIYTLVHWGNLNQILSLKNNWGKAKIKIDIISEANWNVFPEGFNAHKSGKWEGLTCSIHHHGSPDYDWSCPFRNSWKNKVLLMLATIARVSYVARSFDVHKLSLSTVRVNLKTVVILKSYQVICQVLFYMFW